MRLTAALLCTTVRATLLPAMAHADDEARRRHHATIAQREQRILERHFGTTLKRARQHQLRPWRIKAMEQNHDPEQVFVSKAGIRIITGISEGGLRLLMVLAVLALLAAELYLGRRRAHQ